MRFRPAPRPTGRRPSLPMALTGSVVLLAGLAAVPGSAAEQDTAEGGPVRVAFDCAFPSGSRQLTAKVTPGLPRTAEPGKPITSDEARVDLRLSGRDAGELLPGAEGAVTGTADLRVTVRQGEQRAEADWRNLRTAEPAGVGAEGSLDLALQGPLPAVTVPAGGDVSFTAGELTLSVTAQGGGSPAPDDPASPGASQPDAPAAQEAAPASAELVCTPEPGGEATLATVRVAGGGHGEGPGGDDVGGPDQGPSVQPGGSADPENPCPVESPTGELDLSEVPPPPAGDPLREIDLPGQPGCAYALGYATVRKLNGAMIVNDPAAEPALTSVVANTLYYTRSSTVPGGQVNQSYSLGSIDLPDAESTFLTFGFQPTTAKVSFESGPVTVATGTYGKAGAPDVFTYAVMSFTQSLRVHDVKVNGTPLDVGPDCRTEKPFKVVLRGTGNYPNVLAGGRLNGDITVPAFSGCGVNGEDLDPLFTAALSGPGNHIEFNQGKVCLPKGANTVCPPTIPPLPGREGR